MTTWPLMTISVTRSEVQLAMGRKGNVYWLVVGSDYPFALLLYLVLGLGWWRLKG